MSFLTAISSITESLENSKLESNPNFFGTVLSLCLSILFDAESTNGTTEALDVAENELRVFEDWFR